MIDPGVRLSRGDGVEILDSRLPSCRSPLPRRRLNGGSQSRNQLALERILGIIVRSHGEGRHRLTAGKGIELITQVTEVREQLTEMVVAFLDVTGI